MHTELFSPCHPVRAGWTFVTSVVAIWALFLFTNLDAIEAILNSHSGKIKLPLEENRFTLTCSYQYIFSTHTYTHPHRSRNARGWVVNLVSWLSPHWIKWSLRTSPNSLPGPEYFMTKDLRLPMYPDLVKSRHKSCLSSSSLNAQIQNLEWAGLVLQCPTGLCAQPGSSWLPVRSRHWISPPLSMRICKGPLSGRWRPCDISGTKLLQWWTWRRWWKHRTATRTRRERLLEAARWEDRGWCQCAFSKKASKTAQLVKELTTIPEDLSSISRTQTVEVEDSWFPQAVPWLPHALWRTLPQPKISNMKIKK